MLSNDSVFPEDWTMEDFLGKHRSRPYNPLIANAFYRAGFIESWGCGIQKIRTACSKAGNKEPSYLIKRDEIMVVFEAKELVRGEKTVIDVTIPANGEEKATIEARKVAFQQLLNGFTGYATSVSKLMLIFEKLCEVEFFGRKDIMVLCDVKVSGAGDLLAKLKLLQAIEPVLGHGKGKYRFIV